MKWDDFSYSGVKKHWLEGCFHPDAHSFLAFKADEPEPFWIRSKVSVSNLVDVFLGDGGKEG